MGILDLKTNLKSLRYGKDRPFGGSSNQPYVKGDIDVKDSEVGRTGGPDFLLRGGTLVPKRVGNDVSRMTQMFFDLKSPNGLLFTAKQNILSRTAVATQASGKALNEGAYLPTSTLLQVVGNNLGIHLNKQGLDPTKRTGPDAGRKGLADLLGFKDPLGLPVYNEIVTNQQSSKDNRLVQLRDGKLQNNDNFLYRYQGGPGSTLGIGNTTIRRYEFTNINNGYTNLQVIADTKSLEGKGNTNIIDFRQEPGGSKVKTLNYSRPENRIEQRVRLGDPGKKGVDRSNYQIGLGEALDKINALSLYKGEYQLGADKGNDFVKFRIGVIDSGEPNKKTFIHFRAFLDSFSDSYNAEWDAEKFMGRGENFYRYKGFTRTINLSWTVAAQSKQELIPMHQKLNYLASSLTPYYSDIGYMGGNLVSLTLGGYLYEQPGIITSMTLDVPQESPWEIAIPVSGGEEKDVKELPHIIKVTNVQFIPIHTFTPQLQQNKYDGIEAGNGSKWLSSFGKERYIALSNGMPDGKGGGGNNNYGDPTNGSPINEAQTYIVQHPTDNKTVSTIKPQTVQFPPNKINAPVLTNE